MRKLLTFCALITAVTVSALGQGVRSDLNITTTATNVPPGAAANVLTVPNAVVSICAYPASGNPCTNTVPTYSDLTLTQPIGNPITADPKGRLGFFVLPGIYTYTVQNQAGLVVGNYVLNLNTIGILAAPSTTQTVIQPTNTVLGVNGRFLLGGQAANRTFLNPEFSASITDSSPATTNSGAQADFRLTPFENLEVNDTSPNDSAPLYVAHNCNYTTGPPIANGACVGFVPIAVSSPGDEHAGIEAINAIAQVGSTDPLAQAQGIELNMFNNTGADSLLEPNGTYTRGPYFGISSTAGGANRMVAAFNVQDQTPAIAPNSGWQYGLFVERAIKSGILLAGSPIGLEQSATCTATSTTNCSSIPLQFDSSFWNGTNSQPFAIQLSAFSQPGVSEPQCLAVSFTGLTNGFTTCSNGDTTQGSTTINGTLNVSPGVLFLDSISTDVEIGSSTAANNPYIDFHSSGNVVDYDTRIQSTGGTGTLGNGTLNFVAGQIKINGAAGITHTVTTTCGTMIFSNGMLVGGSC